VAPVLEEFDVPIAPLTTLRLGGSARRLVTATDEQEIVDVVRDVDARGEPLLLVGGGSNLVVGDDGFDGTVLRLATSGVQRQRTCAGLRLGVAAGHDWDDFVQQAIEAGAVGVEALSGIPGSAGGTPIQNVGAYGQEVAQTIAWVRVYDRKTGEICGMQNRCLEFGYRDSIFKRDDRYVVLTVWFGFDPPATDGASAPVNYPALASELGVELGATASPSAVREAVLELRRRRGMVLDAADHDTWSAGSFFTNPQLTSDEFAAVAARSTDPVPHYPTDDGRVKLVAAWLIEHAGFGKGFGTGPVTLSSKHTLALTNRGDAKTEDLLALARHIRDGVRERFGVELRPEPKLVGVRL
jgi:UDP-N-acetylmuramate dehydrogenase